jgi:hypothetical protein
MVKGDETDCKSLEDGLSYCSDQGSDSVELLKKRDAHPSYVVHECRTRAYNEGVKNCGVLCFTLFVLILCVASFFFCQNCLFVLLIVSACLCPFFHPMNAPLWLAIVLLTIGGWNFTVGALTITWNYKNQG